MAELAPIKRALVSVSDKTGLLPFVKSLSLRGVEVISTGGTASALRAAGIPVTAIDAVTGFPEIMHGRVKTLHPKVHGGILGVRDEASHADAMREHGIQPIDLVCVNLYPFEETVAKPGCTEADAVENIDIGGPSMVRSAAKNFEWVTIVTQPGQYDRVLHEMDQHSGSTTRTLRAEFAAAAFALTSRYDAAIGAYLARKPDAVFPPLLAPTFVKAEELRYGENPHQAAALYRAGTRTSGPSIAAAEQLHGKELSYNNINDAAAALELVRALARVDGAGVGACVVKHANPCGAAIAATPLDAVSEAILGDPLAAYGGILAINRVLDESAAARLCEKDVFLEVVVAPAFTAGALEALRTRWANVRLLAVGELDRAPSERLEMRSIPGGLLVQERDLVAASEYVRRAGPEPDAVTLRIAAFLEAVCRALMSNAVVVGGASPTCAGSIRMFGGGAGQMDRLTSCQLACDKAGVLTRSAVAFSDAFFPFPDGPQVLLDAGIATIVHPGGSKRDTETFALCESRGVTCLTTGVRHFRH
ncbi:MAG: bifunctional phosphoribosylaminoimidazolecarboxamide formyltransferase/IMP cyclohydrolase [Phycisphaerales bacterium]